MPNPIPPRMFSGATEQKVEVNEESVWTSCWSTRLRSLPRARASPHPRRTRSGRRTARRQARNRGRRRCRDPPARFRPEVRKPRRPQAGEGARTDWKIDLTAICAASISAHRQAALQTACCRAEQPPSWQSILAMARSPRSCATIRESTLRERTNARLLLRRRAAGCGSACASLSRDGRLLHLCNAGAARSAGALGTAEQRWRGRAVILVKPQFEAGRVHVGKGGIVRDPARGRWRSSECANAVLELGGDAIEVIDSPIRGMEGNHEYLLYAEFGVEDTLPE